MVMSRVLRSSLALFCVLVGLAVLSAAPCMAADTGGDAGGKLLDVDWKAMLTTVAVFALLLFVLSKTAWKPILNGLKQREETIQKALDDAKEANEKARQLITDYEQKLETAKDEAAAIADEARRDAQTIRSQIEEDGRKTAAETVARAKVEIEQIAAKARESVVNEAAGLATAAAAKIVKGRLSDDDHAALVSDVVADFAAKHRKDA